MLGTGLCSVRGENGYNCVYFQAVESIHGVYVKSCLYSISCYGSVLSQKCRLFPSSINTQETARFMTELPVTGF